MQPSSKHEAHSYALPRAFTLVELITAIGILGVLIGLVLSGVYRSLQKADTANCLNNARQLILAWQQFADDTAGVLPPNTDGMEWYHIPSNWAAGNMRNPLEETNRSLLTDPNQTLIAPYVRNPSVFRCPAYETAAVRSYSMNCRMNPVRREGPVRWITPGYAVFRTLSEVQTPSEIFVILDESESTINGGSFALTMSTDGEQPSDRPASKHDSAAALTFADAHAEVHHWRKHGSVSPNELQWLRSHSTYPIQPAERER